MPAVERYAHLFRMLAMMVVQPMRHDSQHLDFIRPGIGARRGQIQRRVHGDLNGRRAGAPVGGDY